MAEFTEEQIERYSRQILLPEIGGRGQAKLLGSNVLVVGAGGIGSPVLLYLAAAGVGHLCIADGDEVELSNLQRQIVHNTASIGLNKALSARNTIMAVNPQARVDTIGKRLQASTVRDAVRGYDVVVDGSDNFPTRFLVSDACWLEAVPLVSAAAVRFEGQLLTVVPGNGAPCYRCMLPEPPPDGLMTSCQAAGVLGAAVGVMGALAAAEAIKVLLGLPGTLAERLLYYDALEPAFEFMARRRNPHCALCGPEAAIREPVQYAASCAAINTRQEGDL